MIHYYAFSNYQSFLDKAVVSFVQSPKVSPARWCLEDSTGAMVSTALAIFGANAAGKTAALKALGFLHWFMNDSFQHEPDEDMPLSPHFAAKDKPIEFEAEFGHDGELYRYELSLTPSRVLREALYRKKIRFSYLFERVWSDEDGAYQIKQSGFGLKPSEAQKVRQNASLISTAAQYGADVSFCRLLSSSNVWKRGRRPIDVDLVENASRYYADNRHGDVRDRMEATLRSWDLGLSGVRLVKKPGTDDYEAWGVHEVDGEEHLLPFWEESSGTRAAFVMLRFILTALRRGGVALIDELESDLHPHLIEPIVQMFDSSETNPHGAQLIFTCHAQQILDALRKSQVVFVEKNACSSELYRGDEIKGLRADDNLRAKYAAGALGAVPRY